ADRDRDAGRLQGLPAVARERHRRRGSRQRRDEHRDGGQGCAVEEADRPGGGVASPDLGDLRPDVGRDLPGEVRRRGLQGGHQHLADVGQLDPHVTVAAQQHTVRDHDALAHHARELARVDDGLHRRDHERPRGDQVGGPALEQRHDDLLGDHRLDRIRPQRVEGAVGEGVGLGQLELHV
ncbi:MAG: hypothetical protein AVDCRST_MAG79-942, partial [uncultured Thermoleophilia bacterium]